MHARNFVCKTFLKTHSSFLWPHTGGKGTLQDSVSTTLTLNYLCCNLCPLRGWTVANGPSQGWVWTSMLVLNLQNGYFEWAASVGWGFQNRITFIVTSPQHKCLGEWNSYERAPDSAKKPKQQFTYGQYTFTDCTEDNVLNTHTYTQYA